MGTSSHSRVYQEPAPGLVEQFTAAMRPFWHPDVPSDELPAGGLRSVELPPRPADLPLIEYHRWLEELGISLAL